MSPGCASRSQWTITRFHRPANTRASGLSAAGPMSTWTCSGEVEVEAEVGDGLGVADRAEQVLRD